MRFDSTRRAAALLAMGFVVSFAASNANAGKVKFEADSYGSTGGGEFVWKIVENSADFYHPYAVGDTFISFCLEYNEYIAVGNVYNATIGTAALSGGRGGSVNGKDPLDERTAYLFTQFTNQTLIGYNFADVTPGSSGYTVTRSGSANALQQAIWWIEQEFALEGRNGATRTESVVGSGDQFALAKSYVSLADHAVSSGAWSGLGLVRVMTLTTLSGGKAQDQLIIVPLPPAVLAGAGLLGLVGFTRRRRAK
jgi:hypothetical protein